MNKKDIKYLVPALLVFVLLVFVVVGSLYTIYDLLQPDQETVINNTDEEIEVGVVPYCHECGAGEYREGHQVKSIAPHDQAVFDILTYYSQEHFYQPVFYEVLEDGSKNYYCGRKVAAEEAHYWSDLGKIAANSPDEAGERCEDVYFKTSTVSQCDLFNLNKENLVFLETRFFKNPEQPIRTLLFDAGFGCQGEDPTASMCNVWVLSGQDVSSEALNRLQPYSDQIDNTSCFRMHDNIFHPRR